MNKSIFVVMVIGALAISLVASAVLTIEADALKLSRANKVLDKHIDAGGKHGEAAQRIKDRINDGGDSCPICG